jgi:primosomal protein N' (replication factor Y)
MNPHHYAIRFGVEHDYHGFFAEELTVREALGFPPFNELVDVMVSAADDEGARKRAEDYADTLREALRARGQEGQVALLGPSPAFLHKLRGEYRWSLTIKAPDLTPFKPLLPQERGFAVDVDPM